jgi:hypothetical protein
MFKRNILPLSSGSKSKLNKQPGILFLTVGCYNSKYQTSLKSGKEPYIIFWRSQFHISLLRD